MRATIERLAPPLALYVALVAFSIWHLRQIEDPELGGLWVWAVLALAPALIAALGAQQLAPRRFALLAIPAVITAIGAATGHWPFRPHLLGDTGYFRLVGGDLHDGLDRWVRTLLPYDPVKAPQLHAVVSLAIFACFAALAAALLVWRAPYPAIVVGFIPFLVVSTVYVLPRPTLRAAIFLGLMLAVLGVLSQRRRPTIQLAAGASVVLVAVLAATLPGVAKSAMLDWKQWGKPEKTGTSVGFIWNHTYAGLKRPKKPVTLLRVTADSPSYWRAVVLGKFNGLAWVAEPTVVDTGSPPTVIVPQDALSESAQGLSLKQKAAKFQNVNLATNDLVAPGEVLAIKGIDGDAGQISRTSDGVFSTEKNVPIDSSWTAEYLPVQPTIKDLTEAAPDYPEDLQATDLALLDEGVVFPVWGAPGREATVDDLISTHFFDPQLVRWREVYDKARDITKDAKSPYEAVAAIESYFQSNYKYDEKADYSRATDGPLPSFFLDGKSGYCQMYAGTMTVMLRMLGIPARVGEGFTEGTRNVNRGTYVVTDRDAHAWVEVWFPKFGWMPFEPTPSRELPFDYSTTSKNFSDAATKSLAGVAGFDSARLEQLARLAGTPSRVSGALLGGGRGPREGGGGVGAVVGKDWHPGFVSWLLLIAGALLVLLILAKRLRSVVPYLRKGPHEIAGAVRRDLEAYVRDQGVPQAVVTLTPDEFSRMLHREFGVDAAGWARLQSRARYGPNDGRAYDAARGARSEARVVKRRLRRSLGRTERARGAIRLRSLLP
jgi:transglutaminase-like putative cysteine protease